MCQKSWRHSLPDEDITHSLPIVWIHRDSERHRTPIGDDHAPGSSGFNTGQDPGAIRPLDLADHGDLTPSGFRRQQGHLHGLARSSSEIPPNHGILELTRPRGRLIGNHLDRPARRPTQMSQPLQPSKDAMRFLEGRLELKVMSRIVEHVPGPPVTDAIVGFLQGSFRSHIRPQS
jgi:hypothetical protein